MKRLIMFLILIGSICPLVAQTSPVFYNGRESHPDSWIWTWGFSEDPLLPVDNAGYAPGTTAMVWGPGLPGEQYQGIFFGYDAGFDLTSVWNTDSVYFKLKAPNGMIDTDTIYVWLYDTRSDDWEYASFYKIPGVDVLQDGEWHLMSVALTDFQVNNNPTNTAELAAISFEAYGTAIESEFIVDDVWVGNPDINATMTIFNGKALANGVGAEVWGFDDNTFKFAPGEGFVPGTDAILWENNSSTGPYDAGIGFYFAPQDFTYGMTADTFKIKIKAPAGINDLALVLWDQVFWTAVKVLDNVTWNGEWQEIEVPLADFNLDPDLNLKDIYYFSLAPASAPVPERILIDDIWIGSPFIDFTPPPAPSNLLVTSDPSFPHVNILFWDNIDTEAGETYDIYTSNSPITNLDDPGVYALELNMPESEDATNSVVHRIFHPLTNGEVSAYYAVSATDAAGNVSETFGATDAAFLNTGKKRAIISLDNVPAFTADGDLSEWSNIVPFRMVPDVPRVSGTIDDSLDFSAFCYVAMDSENLYVAFDVFDDNFTYDPANIQPWWEDEAIEFFFGLYELDARPHAFFERGAEPDYRLVFKPYEIELFSGDVIANNTENYYFEPLGQSDYVLEAKIPFSAIQLEGDAPFTPQEGMTIPFEIFASDADVVDGGNEGRLQFGYNPALNPWGEGPEVWTFAWVGLPQSVSIDDTPNEIVYSYALENNYPNPFNPNTTIRFSIPETEHVTVEIYNVLGALVDVVVDERMTVGRHEVQWNGRNVQGTSVSSGVYFYRMQAGDFVQTNKMILLR